MRPTICVICGAPIGGVPDPRIPRWGVHDDCWDDRGGDPFGILGREIADHNAPLDAEDAAPPARSAGTTGTAIIWLLLLIPYGLLTALSAVSMYGA